MVRYLFSVLTIVMIHLWPRASVYQALEVKSIQLVSHSANIFLEDLLHEEEIHRMRFVMDQFDVLRFHFKRASGMTILVSISNIRPLNQYEDVDHVGENRIVLESGLLSNMHHLKVPMLHIIKNFCRYPLPSGYYISMEKFPERYTMSDTVTCSSSMLSQSRCPITYHYGQKYQFRSVNKPCSQKIGGAVLILKDKAPPLPLESNSLYCTQQSEIVTNIFKESVNENLAFLQNSDCEALRKDCDKCFKFYCNTEYPYEDQNCCNVVAKCLHVGACEQFYSLNCGEDENTCYKGTTFKFILTPEFIISNQSFQCHLRKVKPSKPAINIQVNISLPERISNRFYSKFLKIPNYNDNNTITVFGITIKYTSQLNLNNDIIIDVVDNHVKASSIDLKYRESMERIPIQKQFKQKYIKFEMIKPFTVNTESWFNQSCDIDLSNVSYYQSDLDRNMSTLIRTIHQNNKPIVGKNGKFLYTLFPQDDHDRLEVIIPKQKSILREFICENPKKINSLIEIHIDIQLKSQHQFLLKISGSVGNFLSYIALTVYENSERDLLQSWDILISQSQTRKENHIGFWLDYTIDFSRRNVESKNLSVLIVKISDCLHNITRYINIIDMFRFQSGLPFRSLDLKLKTANTNLRQETFVVSERSKILAVISLVVWCVYVVCLLVGVILYFSRKWKLCSSVKHSPSHSKISIRNKLLLAVYLILKIFYTFIFTFTTLLTLLMTLRDQTSSTTQSGVNGTGFTSHKLSHFNSTSLTTCSEQLLVNLRKHLEKFDKKRQENLEIMYSSSQSIQNDSRKLTAIFNDKINFFTIDKWHPQQRKCAQEMENFRKLYSKAFKGLFQSKWFNRLALLSNQSKMLFQQNFDYSVLQRYLDDPTRAVKFTKLINLPELISPFILMNQVENYYNKLFKSTKVDESKYVSPPISLINYSSTFRYMEKLSRCNSGSDTKKLTKCHFPKALTENDRKNRRELSKSVTDTIFIRILMLLLDFMIIAHRSYRIYADVKQFWIGKKTFLEYETPNQYVPIVKGENLFEDESHFKQMNTKITPWTKRQNIHCFNSPDLILVIQIIICSIILTGLLFCLVSRESSIFLLPLVKSQSRTDSWWFLPRRMKFVQIIPKKSMTNQMTEQHLNILKHTITYRYNVTFRFNHYERNIISQYMWEQCLIEGHYERLSNKNRPPSKSSPRNSHQHQEKQPGYCHMPLPQVSVKYKQTFCDNSLRLENHVYFYYLRSKSPKEKPFYVALLRFYLVECVILLYAMILSALALLGVLKVSRKILLRHHSISEFQNFILIVPSQNTDLGGPQSSLDNILLLNQSADIPTKKDCSRKSYSCQKLDTRV